jgi:hypothetical protein
MLNSFGLAAKQDRKTHQRLVQIDLIFPENVRILTICNRSKTRKATSWSVTAYNKTVSGQCDFTSQSEG